MRSPATEEHRSCQLSGPDEYALYTFQAVDHALHQINIGPHPDEKSYSAVRSGQAAAKRMILWPAPSTRAQPARAEPKPVQSIKQPQLDLHSRLHNPGTYRVKAPGRSPLSRPGRKEQADDPHHGRPLANASDRAGRSSVKNVLTPNRRHRAVKNDEYTCFVRRVLRAYARWVAAGHAGSIPVARSFGPCASQRVARSSSDTGEGA